MNQIVGLIMSIVYLVIYVAINAYRFSKITGGPDFDVDSKQLYTIVFWSVRILVIAGLTCFMLFTFQEYVMFCFAKMMGLTLILFCILEIESLGILKYDCNLDDKLRFIYMVIYCIIYIILTIFICNTSVVYVEDKVEVETIYPITASDQNVANGEVNGNMFVVYRYVNQEKIMYFYDYLSNDGSEILTGKSDDKDTKRVLIDEGEKPYIEITTKTEQFYNVEEKERVIYDGNQTAIKTTIYAPLSAYTDISFDAK